MESHALTSKGYAPLGDLNGYDLDYPMEARNRTSSFSILSPTMNKFPLRFSSRRTQRRRLARERSESLTRVRECSPPPTIYQRTTSYSSELDSRSSERAAQFVSSWEGVLEESDHDDSVERLRLRVSEHAESQNYCPGRQNWYMFMCLCVLYHSWSLSGYVCVCGGGGGDNICDKR